MPVVVVPYRGDSKRRLPASIRAAVAVAMLGDVVAAAGEVGRVLVVTDDAGVVPAGVEVVADPGEGLSAAVAVRACAGRRARARRQRRPAVRDAGGDRRLAAAGLALVEAADGTTNALSLPDPSVVRAALRAGERRAVPRARSVRDRRDPGARGGRRHGRGPRAARGAPRPENARAARRARVRVVLLSGAGAAPASRAGSRTCFRPAISRSSGTSATTSRSSACTSRPTSTACCTRSQGSSTTSAAGVAPGRRGARSAPPASGAARTGSGSGISTSGCTSSARSGCARARRCPRSRRSSRRGEGSRRDPPGDRRPPPHAASRRQRARFPFQEWYVGRGHRDEVTGVSYEGAGKRPPGSRCRRSARRGGGDPPRAEQPVPLARPDPRGS